MATVPKLACFLALWLLTGCTATSSLFGGAADTDDTAAAENASAIDTEGLALYLELMSDLVEGDPVTQAEVFDRVSRDAETAPTTTNLLKLALALAVPSHPNSNAEHAAVELRSLLAEDAVLLPEERVLAAIHLEDVEQRLVLEGRATELQESASEEIGRQLSEAEARIGALEEENRQLRLELESTRQIIDEIANIEREIRERDNGSDQ